MRLAFHPEALTEYSEATLYYEERQNLSKSETNPKFE